MAAYQNAVKQPGNLSPRVKWLRDYYFEGIHRKWNNEYTAYSTGKPWDKQFNEMDYYIVPEMYAFMDTFTASVRQAAEVIEVDKDFWKKPLVERKAIFTYKAVAERLPVEILPGDLICGARFNLMTSMCLKKGEQKRRDKLVKAARQSMRFLHDHGYGNSGATSGHLIPDYAKILKYGFKEEYRLLQERYDQLSEKEKKSQKGAQLRAMMTACLMPRDLAARYSKLCLSLAGKEKDEARRQELLTMAANTAKVPWEPAENFFEAVQSLWLTHMLIMSDENYPGPGVSFGRIDQYLYPYYEASLNSGMSKEFMKEILGCFWVHCNTAYDAQIRVGGNQGITAGFGQLLTLSGMGEGGKDMTNGLTYLFLDVIDDMSPILEPKPNVRIHNNSPDELLDKMVDMISRSQGAPFLINFDERSMAGMMREAKRAKIEHLINLSNVHEYAPVGCLENTMVGNDRSGTVDNNVNLLKAVELVFGNGKDMAPYFDPMTGKYTEIVQEGPVTGELNELDTFDKFYAAFGKQTAFIIKKMVENYELSESIRAEYHPTPYLSLLVKGCREKCKDITQGGAEIGFVTMEGVTFGTTVDSLLAVKYLVYDKKECTLEELRKALLADWKGYEILQSKALYKAPKYGRDDDEADALGLKVMDTWAEEVWKYKTRSTGRQFRPGMLSWNYWIGSGYILKASPNGRNENQFLSNAICPSNGADIFGPTANSNSVGKVLGGKGEEGDYLDYLNNLPNGASHTITFNTALLKDAHHKEKFKSFLRGYCLNGGTALQINILDVDMLKDAQAHPQNYRHLLVRITGYNAYFVSVGKELQDEIIARESHRQY
ncbi:MAG TPA: pyruvate formate lyase family protein [Clostridia bacterium]|nr:pyruvate formate lyase family protein [Clostridia bacterium]